MRTLILCAGIAGLAVAAARTLPPSAPPPASEQQRALAALQANPFAEAAWTSVRDALAARHIGLASFNEGTPEAYIAWREQRLQTTARYQLTERWPADGFNKGLTLTYSFPPDGTDIAANGFWNLGAETIPNERVNHLHSRFEAFFGDESTWKAIFRDAYDNIESMTGLTFIEVEDDGAPWPTSPGPLNGGAGRGDLRIVSALDDGLSNVLAFNFLPLFGGDMLFDSGDLSEVIYGSFLDNYQKFRNVTVHETGHGVGLLHSCPLEETKVMEPIVSTILVGMQFDDMLGAQTLYGDVFERGDANDTSMTATTMAEAGLFVNGSTRFIPNLSINVADDVDVYLIDSPGGSYVDATVTVTPAARTYLSGPQISGFCSPGTSFSSVSRADLRLRVRDLESPDETLIDEKSAGMAETTQFMMVAGQHFAIEIDADPGAGFLGIQAYNLTVRLKKVPHPLDLDQNGCIDGIDIAFILSQWGDSGSFVPADVTGDNLVDGRDIAAILAAWAPCQ